MMKSLQLALICVSFILVICEASDVKSITLPRTFNAREEGWFNLNHPMIYFDPSMYTTMTNTMRQLPGIQSVRIPVHWAIMEPNQNETSALYLQRLDAALDALNASSIGVVLFFVGSPAWISSDTTNQKDTFPPLYNGPYVDRAVWLAKRYQYRGLEAIQVWNEVNLPGFWGPVENPTAYYQLYQETCAAVRGNVSTVSCLYAGMAYYSQMPNYGGSFMFQALQQVGGLEGVSSVAYHPYFNRPEGDDGDNNPHDFLEGATFLNGQLKLAGVGKVWAGETGWSTYTGAVVEQPLITEDEQADYLVRRLVLLAATGFDRIFIFDAYDFPDGLSGNNRDDKYGIVDNTGRKKPAFGAIKFYLQNFFMGATQPLGACNVDNSTLSPSNTTIYAVSMTVNSTATPRHVVFLWSPSGYRGALSVTCGSVVSGYLSSGAIVGTVVDVIRQTQVSTVSVSGAGAFSIQLDSSIRAVVFTTAAAPLSVAPSTVGSTPQQMQPQTQVSAPKSAPTSSATRLGYAVLSLILCIAILL